MASLAVCAALLAHGMFPAGAAQRPLPEREAFFDAARDNLARATREQHRYAYKERRTELHMNPFGRLGTGEVRVYEVTPGPTPDVYYRRLLEKDGQPVANSEPERQERRQRERGERGKSSVEDTVDTLQFDMERRERVDGRDMIVISFEPRANADPVTREGKLAKSFEGTIWIDEAAREVRRVEAEAIDSLSFGFGLIARLGEGTVATLTREPVGDGIWLPTSLRFQGEGRALFFLRKLTVDHVIEWFDYRKM